VIDGVEEDAAGAVDALGWVDDALEVDEDVLAGEGGAVVELDALAEVEGVGHPVLRHVPADREIRQNLRLIVGVELQQRIETGTDTPEIGAGRRLVQVQVRRIAREIEVQDTAATDSLSGRGGCNVHDCGRHSHRSMGRRGGGRRCWSYGRRGLATTATTGNEQRRCERAGC